MISKAKARNASFEDTNFRYKISSKPVSNGIYELNITIQSENHNASKLIVTGVMQHDYAVKPPLCSEDHKFFETIVRIDIEGYIAEAVELGWDYKQKGSDFVLTSSNEPYRQLYLDENKPAEWFHARHYHLKNKLG
ncbi:hypothetical protein [Rubritalea sp.]|uniref:hypothetical protein n=1 Tax=Rubritalea sp. TaxID=2109375 RepID=UPI003EF3DD4B